MAETLIQQLRQQVADDPYDYVNWENLLFELGNGPKSSEQTASLREVYENILAIFPTSCAYWKEYCEFEIENGNEETVKSLFGKCLLVCLDVDLWYMYVDFIKSVSEEDIEQRKSSLEFALEHVGQDIRSGSLWVDYIDLLKSIDESSDLYQKVFGNSVEGQSDAAKTAALRRAIHRALNVPNESLDIIWGYYEDFENSLGNKTLVKRFLDEWRPKYHASKVLSQERSLIVQNLDTSILPLPPGKGGYYQMEEAQKWRQYTQWERCHPADGDGPTHQERVVLAFEQSLSYFIQFPDIWIDYATWNMSEQGKGIEAAIHVLGRGREALPDALILHLGAADLYEQAGNVDKARAIYDEITSTEDDTMNIDGQKELKTLAWIHYMRFARRVDGVMAARKLFMRARKWKDLQWQAYVASARFEWMNERKDSIPRNILELGLKSYIDVPAFVVEYAKFLIGIGDVTNTRSLFERALTATKPESSLDLWDAYIEFESEFGSLATVIFLESRRKDALQSSVGLNTLDCLHTSLLKHKVLGMYPGQPEMFEVSPDLFHGTGDPENSIHAGKPPPPPSPPFLGGRVPRDLHQLMKQLQGPPEGPVPDIDHILNPITNFEFTASGIETHEIAMGRQILAVADSSNGPLQRSLPKRQASTRGRKRKSVKDMTSSESPLPVEESLEPEEGSPGGNDVYRRRMRTKS